MSSGTWAIIPVKPLQEAKTRLRPALSVEERARLSATMLELVLAAVHDARGLAGWALVSRDERIRLRAQTLGGAGVREQGRGLNRALQQASQWCVARGADAILVLHADLPRLRSSEIESMLAQDDGQAGLVLAPSRDGSGTNAMLLRPPGVVPFSFGSGSLARYMRTAFVMGIRPLLFHSPGLATDVDTPTDLLRWRSVAAIMTDQARGVIPPGAPMAGALSAQK